MQHKTLLTDSLLLTTAAIWGLAFVAQRVGMDHIGPFTYNGIRFLLGAATLVPVLWWTGGNRPVAVARRPGGWRDGLLAGGVLFLAASLQQIGLVYTTAGNAGFITGLYVVLVPLLGMGRRQRVGAWRWLAVLLAVSGIYLLSVQEGLRVNPGDLYVMGSALFFAVHVQVIDTVSRRSSALRLSVAQYGVVGVLSLLVGLLSEPLVRGGLAAATPAILYGGLGSISVAYTLQTLAQRRAEPSHAAILLSLEGAFAALGGWLILGELLGGRGLLGSLLVLGGMLLSQLAGRRRSPAAT